MQTITLENGFKYQSFWGGELRQPSDELLKRYNYKHVWGDYNSVRKYHELTLHDINGIKWIEEYQKEADHPQDYCDHHDFYSCDGKYHIAKFHIWSNPRDNSVYFVVFKASAQRDNMQSTFGDYLFHKDTTFNTFKECAEAVATHSINKE